MGVKTAFRAEMGVERGVGEIGKPKPHKQSIGINLN